jgi:hypothetical protein
VALRHVRCEVVLGRRIVRGNHGPGGAVHACTCEDTAREAS